MPMANMTLDFVMAIVLVAAATNAQESVTLDLTNPPWSEQKDPLGLMRFELPSRQALGAPDVSIPATSTYTLPLTLELRSVTQEARNVLIVEVQLTNEGPVPFLLALSLDPARTPVLPGNLGKRRFGFELTLRALEQQPEVTLLGPVTDGSQTAERSLMPVNFGESVLIRFKVNDQGSIRDWALAGAQTIEFQAVVREWRLHDERYSVIDASEPIESSNVIRSALAALARD